MQDLLASPKCSLLVSKDPEDRTDLVIIVHGDALPVSIGFSSSSTPFISHLSYYLHLYDQYRLLKLIRKLFVVHIWLDILRLSG